MEQKRFIEKIREANSVTEALNALDQEEKPLSLPAILAAEMASRNLSTQELAKMIDVERSTLYRLLSGERLTTRNVLLRLALVLGFTVEKTQALLRVGQRAELYAPVKRDAVLLFCLDRGESLALTEATLLRKGYDSLFERR